MIKISKDKFNAAKLCRFIDELSVPFLNKRADTKLYTGEEMKKIRFLKRFFGLDEIHDLMILCHMIENRFRRNSPVCLEEIANKFKMRFEEYISLNASLDTLVRKRLIRISDDGFMSRSKEYAVAQNCMNAIYEFNKELIKPQQENTFESFMYEFQMITENHEYYGKSITDNIGELTEEFSSLEEIRWLKTQQLGAVEQFILLAAVRSYIFEGNNFDLEDSARLVTSSKHWLLRLERELIGGSSELMLKELLEFKPGPFQNVHQMRLTQKSIQGLCASLEQSRSSNFHPKMFRIIDPAGAGNEYIHDNPDLRLIEKMISREHYEKVRTKVPRLSVLLTGAPGVGKTSFVSHIARMSGRLVLSVNIAEILSCYVGESEKNLVNLFREAGQAYEFYEVTPIIVFDEAETLLYNRKAGAGKAVEQMNNNIISLLLASLDNFRGILICCSNFSFSQGAFDPALHRRFHMVSEIAVPPANVRKSILNSHFPSLTTGECDAFLERYPFITPAQIRNIREKYDVQCMLEEVSDLAADIDRIASRDLSLFIRKQYARIGFSMQGTD